MFDHAESLLWKVLRLRVRRPPSGRLHSLGDGFHRLTCTDNVSPTASTVMSASRMPLSVWFWEPISSRHKRQANRHFSFNDNWGYLAMRRPFNFCINFAPAWSDQSVRTDRSSRRRFAQRPQPMPKVAPQPPTPNPQPPTPNPQPPTTQKQHPNMPNNFLALQVLDACHLDHDALASLSVA